MLIGVGRDVHRKEIKRRKKRRKWKKYLIRIKNQVAITLYDTCI